MFRWDYALDWPVAVVLTAASLGAPTTLDGADVWRWPESRPRPELPLGVDKDDWAAAAASLGYEQVSMRPAVVLWWVFTAALAAALLMQRRWPVAALIAATAGAAGHQLWLYPPDGYFYLSAGWPATSWEPIDLAVLITLLTLASRVATRWAAALACGGVLAAAYAVELLDAALHPAWAAASKPAVIGTAEAVVIIVVFALSDSIRSHRARQKALDDAAAAVEREQQRAALAAASERARITRELHDVVAHSLAVMVAQAQAAVAAQHTQPERTGKAITEVVNVGRAALAEMRRMVGAVRSSPTSPPEEEDLTPQPGIEALPALFERVRAAGVEVDVDVDVDVSGEGEPVELPASVQMAAYRIVQEALTNTIKHAGRRARATVRLAYREGHLDIAVRDYGGGAGPPAEDSGNGLRGIEERVSLLGGEVTAGPMGDHGFEVKVRLPIEPVPAA
ncbi:MAG TPA: histidine kinase [Candidatus Limnocylindrales bacterium]